MAIFFIANHHTGCFQWTEITLLPPVGEIKLTLSSKVTGEPRLAVAYAYEYNVKTCLFNEQIKDHTK